MKKFLVCVVVLLLAGCATTDMYPTGVSGPLGSNPAGDPDFDKCDGLMLQAAGYLKNAQYRAVLDASAEVLLICTKKPVSIRRNDLIDVAQLYIGIASQNLGDYVQAVKSYTYAIQPDTKAWVKKTAYQGRGAVRSLSRDYAGALTDFTSAIILDPKDNVSYSGRAAAKLTLGDQAGAEADALRAYALNNNDGTAVYVIASIRILQGNIKQGCEFLALAYTLGVKSAGSDMAKYCNLR